MVRKKKQALQEVPIDKVENFMFQNYKKVVFIVGAALLVFIAIYTVRQVMSVNDERVDNEIGIAETMLSISGGSAETLATFKSLASKKSSSASYIYLKSGIIEAHNDLPGLQQTLASVKGGLRELADGLAFDMGIKGINPQEFIKTGKMKPLWYYRSILVAQGDEKAKLLSEFAEKYPENPLYELVARW